MPEQHGRVNSRHQNRTTETIYPKHPGRSDSLRHTTAPYKSQHLIRRNATLRRGWGSSSWVVVAERKTLICSSLVLHSLLWRGAFCAHPAPHFTKSRTSNSLSTQSASSHTTWRSTDSHTKSHFFLAVLHRSSAHSACRRCAAQLLT